MKNINFENSSPEIAKITINRPNVLNALDSETLNELSEAIDIILSDEKIKVSIITGNGNAFVAGADLKELQNLEPEEAEKLSNDGKEKVFDKIANSKKPFIASVNGYALGGGLELALSCHLRLASQNAIFGLPEVNLGLIPGYGGTQRLPEIIGKTKALELILLGKTFTAKEALEFGLLNKITGQNQLLKEADQMAQKIAHQPIHSIELILESVQALESGLGNQKESTNFGKCFLEKETEERIKKFVEKKR